MLLNDGAETFVLKESHEAGGSEVFSADLDGDGDNDLAVSDFDDVIGGNDDFVTVLLNQGDGTFSNKRGYNAGDGHTSIFIADVDGDEKNDLAVTNWGGGLSVLLNRGDGTFAPKVQYDIGASASSVFIADIDGDGENDLLVASRSGGTVAVLLNQGDGTFAAKVDYAAGTNPGSVFSADLDADEDNDLVVAHESGVSVLLNQGDGTFAAKVDYAAGTNARSVSGADLDGDGDKDLAVDNNRSNNVSVLLNLSVPPTAIIEQEVLSIVPKTYALSQNFPNPFNPQTAIHFGLPIPGRVELAVFNMMGQQVATLVEGMREAGTYAIHWDGRADDGQALASGVYFYRLRAGREREKTRKLLLLR